MRVFKNLTFAILGALALAGAPAALAAGGGAGLSPAPKQQASKANAGQPGGSGGAGVAQAGPSSTSSQPVVAGSVAKIIHGVAYAPSDAPIEIQRAIWAGNKIRHKPYIYGGGHGSFNDSGYDCSGAVSYVLHAAGLLSTPMDSGEFEGWGHKGHGNWITVYTNPGHAFVEIAGVRLDTSSEGDPNPPPGSGPRWRPLLQDKSGFDARRASAF